MIRKSQLVNALFLVGFPLFGYSSYYGATNGLSKGFIMAAAPFVAIILFHFIDTLYRRSFERRLTPVWWLCMAYMATLVWSMFVGLRHGIPGVQMGNVLLSSLIFLAPFNAAVIVIMHNRDEPDFSFGRLLFMGLGLLLLINVLGYFAGVTALGTGDERAIFPYIRGRYTGVHVLAVFCLMLMFQLTKPGRRPVYFLLILIAYLMCVYFMIQINSRLSFMVFVVLTVLFMTRAIKVVRGLYTISLFTIPLLLSFSLLVYKVLTTPVFAAILQRVSKEDVTTFNGRSYIWTAIGDWALHDRTGLLFGNGYKGHYYLHLLDFVAVLWQEPHAYNLHSHSTFTEVLVGQGILGIALLYFLLWKGFKYYRARYLEGGLDAPLFAGFVYLLFIWQLDIFCYGTDIGHSILFCMLAPLCLAPMGKAR
ncbi:MAG: hypothetical protein IT226_11160 [Flavobacteriales bacterium]|nr:hypothetical protein [Flavobacteriales bacterium]